MNTPKTEVKRTLDGHKVNGVNDGLEIVVMDDPGSGGAHHDYEIRFRDTLEMEFRYQIKFQKGPIKEVGVNGVTHEALLEIVMDRLRCFQEGPYASPDNAAALEWLMMAQHKLQERTRKRLARGVEGTHQV